MDLNLQICDPTLIANSKWSFDLQILFDFVVQLFFKLQADLIWLLIVELALRVGLVCDSELVLFETVLVVCSIVCAFSFALHLLWLTKVGIDEVAKIGCLL